MGAKWQVSAWFPGAHAYRYVYGGDSFWRAIRAAIGAKRTGADSVKVEWWRL